MMQMNEEELTLHLTRLLNGYKQQLGQLEPGLVQMEAQMEQTAANLPLLKEEIENVKGHIIEIQTHLGLEEEE